MSFILITPEGSGDATGADDDDDDDSDDDCCCCIVSAYVREGDRADASSVLLCQCCYDT